MFFKCDFLEDNFIINGFVLYLVLIYLYNESEMMLGDVSFQYVFGIQKYDFFLK